MTITGTNHFVTYGAALRYYRDYEDDAKAAVTRKLLDHDIRLGPPELHPGQTLITVDSGLRYAIQEDE